MAIKAEILNILGNIRDIYEDNYNDFKAIRANKALSMNDQILLESNQVADFRKAIDAAVSSLYSFFDRELEAGKQAAKQEMIKHFKDYKYQILLSATMDQLRAMNNLGMTDLIQERVDLFKADPIAMRMLQSAYGASGGGPVQFSSGQSGLKKIKSYIKKQNIFRMDMDRMNFITGCECCLDQLDQLNRKIQLLSEDLSDF